jgi:hypothetical protein
MEREISQEAWPSFFDSLSRRQEDCLVTVDCQRVGSAFCDAPLRSIATGEGVIEIFVSEPDGGHMMHVVRRPSRVFVDEADADELTVTLVNRDGKRTVARFRYATAVSRSLVTKSRAN